MTNERAAELAKRIADTLNIERQIALALVDPTLRAGDYIAGCWHRCGIQVSIRMHDDYEREEPYGGK